jgi:sodium/bile acid cotransporter 7
MQQALAWIDRCAILVVVYVAFSAAVVRGLWQTVSGVELALLVLVDGALLGLVIALTTLASRLLHMPRADEIAIVMCGSKKSLATGVPMAGLLFPEAVAGTVLLPLMLFHQIQLMVMAVLSQRLARRSRAEATGGLER